MHLNGEKCKNYDSEKLAQGVGLPPPQGIHSYTVHSDLDLILLYQYNTFNG